MRSALILVLAASACISVNKSILMDRSAYPVEKADVRVFLPDDEVPESCERVALLSASGDEDWTDESQMIDKLREETGKLGGNAVLIRSMEDPGTGERIVAAIFDSSADRDAEAVALWCPDGDGR